MSIFGDLLEGMACPRCGHEGDFRVNANVWLDVTNDGSVPSEANHRGDHEWEGDAITECPKCDYIGRWHQFEIGDARGIGGIGPHPRKEVGK